jgi:hypothetical protein
LHLLAWSFQFRLRAAVIRLPWGKPSTQLLLGQHRRECSLWRCSLTAWHKPVPRHSQYLIEDLVWVNSLSLTEIRNSNAPLLTPVITTTSWSGIVLCMRICVSVQVFVGVKLSHVANHQAKTNRVNMRLTQLSRFGIRAPNNLQLIFGWYSRSDWAVLGCDLWLCHACISKYATYEHVCRLPNTSIDRNNAPNDKTLLL